MHYLKCNKCGHLNEVKTEYLIFCSSCNKKLENNYSDWSKRNPDKTFNDFKQLICTTEMVAPAKTKTKSFQIKGLKYWIGSAAALAIVFGIFFAIAHFGGDKLAGLFKKNLYDKAMMGMASELNKNCPIMIDNQTRLDNVITLPDDVFQYNYTLVNMVKDSINVDEVKNYLEPNILNNIKTNPQMKIFRDNKMTMNYYYKDKAGSFRFDDFGTTGAISMI